MRCLNARKTYNTLIVKSCAFVCLLAPLFLGLGAPDFSARLFNESVVVFEGERDETVPGDESENQEESSEQEDTPPKGQLVPPPVPFELSKRTARTPGVFECVARPLEKQITRTRRVAPAVTRIERVLAQVRCVSMSLAVVAPPVQSHAPPAGSSML